MQSVVFLNLFFSLNYASSKAPGTETPLSNEPVSAILLNITPDPNKAALGKTFLKILY